MIRVLCIIVLLVGACSGASAADCDDLRASHDLHFLSSTVLDVHYPNNGLNACFAGFASGSETSYRFGLFKNGKLIYLLPEATGFQETNILSTDDNVKNVHAVSFRDVDEDGRRDVVIFGIVSGWGGDSNFALVYWGCEGKFIFDETLSSLIQEFAINDSAGHPYKNADIWTAYKYMEQKRSRNICPK